MSALSSLEASQLSEAPPVTTEDALLYTHKYMENDSASGATHSSLYDEQLGHIRQSDVSMLHKLLADVNGGWHRLYSFAAAHSSEQRSDLIRDDKNYTSLDESGTYHHVPALQPIAEHMQARLDTLIGRAWDSRPQRIELAYNSLKNILNYAPNWGRTAPDGSMSLSYIQFACGLSLTVISDASIKRPLVGKLISSLARCAALEVLKDYILKKIDSYKIWLQTAYADGLPSNERQPVEHKAKNATAAAMLIDRALDIARMRVHVFKGMELAQSLANLKQSILNHMARGDIEPSMHERAKQSVRMIDFIIAQAAKAYVPCSINCTTNIVHERAAYLEEIAFGGNEARCSLAEDAMTYGYEALAMQLDAKRYCPSSKHVPLEPRALPAELPTNMMALQ